ncbi:helix-turn-helix domain-containing GNAT family N-acetyltransferase [Temperatibacter marinus]|uniref:Helix-turn-helix domain-containing GNAT family N-acetyltransferase n=1 Tax=Temperatibacter marinus TaxID=1456591 RepID=A0AA52H9Q0_9PROT|nr:helix-turn-helix domain-containing GNAT family N-acetyltransferase [Temperatibacter marinus]WND01838.1 helix-turn-helix domain-containing GNAT family N-acetyltransferase [Temperatibacter marinus]
MISNSQIFSIRRFNRFYTYFMGLLNSSMYGSDFSLTEGRLIYELANSGTVSAKALCQRLDLDPGYVSRKLKVFEKIGLVRREKSKGDGRVVLLFLTPKGEEVAAELAVKSAEDIHSKLGHLNSKDLGAVVDMMASIEQVTSGQKAASKILIRPYRVGDMGWVLEQHGVLYSNGYGWTKGFEALTAKIIADFMENFDPVCEQAFIAELNGERVGSIFLVKDQEAATARIRLFLMDPKARGLGLGQELVKQAIDFARDCEYEEIVLWTNAVLKAARHIYEKAGFTLVHEEMHTQFGLPMLGHTFRLKI